MRVRAWRWVEFAHSARGDSLALSHWEQFPHAQVPPLQHGGASPDAQPADNRADGEAGAQMQAQAPARKDSPFAKFNKKVSVPQYTQEEYAQHLLDPNFSEEETQLLLEL